MVVACIHTSERGESQWGWKQWKIGCGRGDRGVARHDRGYQRYVTCDMQKMCLDWRCRVDVSRAEALATANEI